MCNKRQRSGWVGLKFNLSLSRTQPRTPTHVHVRVPTLSVCHSVSQSVSLSVNHVLAFPEVNQQPNNHNNDSENRNSQE
jgi:hypothetical protein